MYRYDGNSLPSCIRTSYSDGNWFGYLTWNWLASEFDSTDMDLTLRGWIYLYRLQAWDLVGGRFCFSVGLSEGEGIG